MNPPEDWQRSDHPANDGTAKHKAASVARALDVRIKEGERALQRRAEVARDVVVVVLVEEQLGRLADLFEARVQFRRVLERHRFVGRAMVKLQRPLQVLQVG